MNGTGGFVKEAMARAKELLLMQGFGSTTCALVTEDEAKRFILATKMDVERAAEGLARRAKFLDKYLKGPGTSSPSLDFAKLKQLLPMYWSRSPNGAVLFASFTKAFDTNVFLECCGGETHGKQFFEWFGETVSRRCTERTDQLTVILDMSDAPFGQTTTPEFDQLVRTGASFLQSMHPERLKNVFVLSAPSTFPMMMYSLRRVCSAQTLKKFVTVESANKLSPQVVSQEYVPRSLGGLQKQEWSDRDSIYQGSGAVHLEANGISSTSEQTISTRGVPTETNDPDSLRREVEQLLELFKVSVEKADECERRHLEENARLRRKLQVAEKNAEKPLDAEEAELRAQLQTALDERDAYRRAVAFARNFIDQEMEERREFIADIEQEIEQKRRENLALVDALKAAFGSDAPNLFL